MIFVTVGTTKFEHLIMEIDRIAPEIKEKIILQIGEGKYLPKNCEYFRMKKTIIPLIKKADLIVTHGGAGTLFELLAMNKKIIGVNNSTLIDEHQKDLLKKLSKEKYLIWCDDIGHIKRCMLISKNFQYRKYKKPRCDIHKKISGLLK